jgi:hypothetical protein
MRRALVVLVAVVAVLPLVAFGQGTPVTDESSPVASPAASDIGKTVEVGNWSVMLRSAEFAPIVAADSWLSESARGKFLIVWLAVVNDGVAPASFPYDDAYAADHRHRMFTPNHDAMLALMLDEQDLTPSDDLQPGITYPYALVFDVAPDATGFHVSLTGKDEPSFELGI